MGLFRKDPPPKAKGQYILHSKADYYTSRPDPHRKPSWPSSEPAYEVRVPESGRRYAPLPTPSHYGPHFEKGPSQEEIWNTRKKKEIWHSEKEMDNLNVREEYRSRAHSFHEPVKRHQYSDPYEKRPVPWTDQMVAERDEYHRFSDVDRGVTQAITDAKKVRVGRKVTPIPDHGKQIMHGISIVKASRLETNRAVQSRTGFNQKYPQAYEEKGLEGHTRQVNTNRTRAINMRKSEKELVKNYDTWKRRMESYS